MPLFAYDSYSRRGSRVSGTIDAPTIAVAKELLKGQGLMPIKLHEVTVVEGRFSFASLFEKKVDFKTKILFTKQLSVLLRSGVPLLQAIELLTEQFEGSMRRILIAIKDGLKAGESFNSLLAQHPKVFTTVYVQLVKAGEASGKLEIILDRLTTYLERSEETRKKVKKALAYPLTMLGFALAVIIGVLTFLVPRMTMMLVQSGKELPGPTKLLVALSDLLVNNYLILSIAVGLLMFGLISWRRTPRGRYRFDEFVLRLPLIAYFAKIRAVVQFCKTLGMLLESGVNLPDALDIVSNIVDNQVLVTKLHQARDKIIKEGRIAKYLKETGIFPAIASYMISTGEQSGKLAHMLLNVGSDYEVELNELTDSITEKINPIMMMVMAVIVLFIMLAIFLPIMELGDIAGI